ncbi:Dph6-related ATP pyrophosphatase [Niameybacter massiliensis]|uniref:Dph6-related ATP pyrophosphatase n=1 Tax=Niameybacter massiliensis TaxID=1658108 RepID=UPI0006B4CF82|nr:diphthine--ammonia ligase [Niameybacter massiliensis]
MKNWKQGAVGKKFIASYSGGKDSSLALYQAMQQGEAIGIIAMMEEKGIRSRSHGLSEEMLQAQAEAIGVPLYIGCASWEGYEEVFIKLLQEAKEKGAQVLVTGDIDVPEHECWHERVTESVGLGLGMPLWEMDHREVVKTFIEAGFITKIVTVNLNKGMRAEDLGRILTKEYMQELEERGIDPCGEAGEFHTTVIDGPLFKKPIPVKDGEITSRGEYMYLSLALDR